MVETQTKLKLDNQELFDRYRANYETLPSYKKVLSSMIKFREMYQPIRRGGLYIDFSGYLAAVNEERRWKRAQIYLNKRDLIQTFDEIHGKRIVVTSRGHKIFYQDYPLARLRQKRWDGVWTVVMYDFPERERARRRRIRRRLIDLGFGCPQISILVSPLPVEEPIQKLLEGERIADRVWTLRAKRILGMDNRQVVRRAWPIIDELSQLYEELQRVLPSIKGNDELLTQWKIYFLAINSADPYLPFELLPKDWEGEVCEREFVKLGRAGFLRALLRELSQAGSELGLGHRAGI